MTVAEAADFLNITSQAVVKKLKSKNLNFNKSQNRIYFGYSTSRELFNIKINSRVIATQIVKGGTGKSNLTMNLAARANLYGLRVLCIDLDQQANLTELFGLNAVEEYPVMFDILQADGKIKIENNLIEITKGLHLFPSRLENAALDDIILIKGLEVNKVYQDLIMPLKSYYDVIFIDCPPALGRSVVAAAYAADKIIAPVVPDRLCLTGLRLLHETLEEIGESPNGKKIPYDIIYNKFDSRLSLSKIVLKSLLTNDIYKDKVNSYYVRQCQEFSNAAANRASVYDVFKSSPAKEDIDLLVQNLLGLKKCELEKTTSKKVSLVSISPKPSSKKRKNTF